jgi:hypothetical protein
MECVVGESVIDFVLNYSILIPGTTAKPLSVAQSRDETLTKKYSFWQRLWQSGSSCTL